MVAARSGGVALLSRRAPALQREDRAPEQTVCSCNPQRPLSQHLGEELTVAVKNPGPSTGTSAEDPTSPRPSPHTHTQAHTRVLFLKSSKQDQHRSTYEAVETDVPEWARQTVRPWARLSGAEVGAEVGSCG